jgi:signal transduction histidine kinase
VAQQNKENSEQATASEQFAVTLDDLPCGALLATLQGPDRVRLHNLNGLAAEMLGVAGRELSLDELKLPESDVTRLIAGLRTESAMCIDTPIIQQEPDGLGGSLRWTAGAGSVVGKVVVLSNVAEAATQNLQIRAAFFDRMSHELRTPLNAIIGFSSIIGRQTFGVIGKRYLEYAEDINQSAEHLLELVSDILELSKAESGDIELDLQSLDPGAVATHVVNLVGPQAERAGIVLRFETAIELPSINADQQHLHLLLRHLLINAIKFSSAGSKVDVLADEDGGIVRFRIVDYGIGMEQTEISRALGIFDQVDDRLERRYDGVGVGLPLAVRLVDVMGGSLDIDSEKGKGTTVTISFRAIPAVHNSN